MKVKELIEALKDITGEIQVAADEEWNIIYKDFRIAMNEETGNWVIFGLSGSEVQE